LAGVNGVITWPADPVMLTIQPTDAMRAMPGGVVTGPLVGLFAGTLQGVFRLFTGTLDIALCPLSFFPMFSIEPRYKLIPGWEHAG
jgi:LytS/YehU family sensor histidine kinase